MADFPVNVQPTLPRKRSNWSNDSRYMYQSRSWLTNEQIAEVLQAVAGGQSLRRVAKEFGVSHETIRAIIKAEFRYSETVR
jgi:DNA-binding NarL/FixJ family response regulator